MEKIEKIDCYEFMTMEEGEKKDHLRYLISDYCLNSEGSKLFFRSQNYNVDNAMGTMLKAYRAECVALAVAQSKYPEEKWHFIDNYHGYFFLTDEVRNNQPDLKNIYNETIEVKSYGLCHDYATIFSGYDDLESIYSHTFHNATYVAIVNLRDRKIAFFDREHYDKNAEIVEFKKGSNKIMIKNLFILEFSPKIMS